VSLRQRFLVMLLLAVVGIGAAGRAGFHLRAESSTVRERQAFDEADRAVEELVRRAQSRTVSNPDPTVVEMDSALAETAKQVLASVFEAAGGYCDADGSLLVTAAGASRFDWPERIPAFPAFPRPNGDVATNPANPPPAGMNASADPGPAGPTRAGSELHRPLLLPADRASLVAACRAAQPDRTDHKRVSLPHDLLMFSLRGGSGGLVAWTMIRLPPEGTRWSGMNLFLEAGVVALATLAFVAIALGALVALRRGAADLDAGLAMLQTDLQAKIPLPRIGELKRVAAGLRQMATHLAETQERERALAAKLVHEQRLGALGRVAAGVAHEVRNPLTGIKLTLDNMARRHLDERSANDVAICREEIARIDRVVSSLLLVARKGALEATKFDAAELVDERMAIAAGLAAARDVQLVRDGSVSITANRDALSRVIDNLLRNGMEASPEKAEVRVELRHSGGDARIRFIDRGAGVPDGRLGELFEPFFTLKPEGTGLGLFLSRSLLEAHGGTLTYDREDGATCFSATLPTDSPTCPRHPAS
jgi:signal transduction histidine kinase